MTLGVTASLASPDHRRGDSRATGLGPRPRQLRLVEEDDPRPGLHDPRSGLHAPPPGDQPGDTCCPHGADSSLAEYLLGLGVGSPCFCCGGPLSAMGTPTPEGQDIEGPTRLECRACGASLEGPASF